MILRWSGMPKWLQRQVLHSVLIQSSWFVVRAGVLAYNTPALLLPLILVQTFHWKIVFWYLVSVNVLPIIGALEWICEFSSSDSNRQFPILVAGNRATSKATRTGFRRGHGNREMQRASTQARSEEHTSELQ